MSQPMIYDGLDVIQQLGSGYSANVQLVERCGQLMALKVFKAKQEMFYENEKKAMQLLLDVPGVIRFRESECSGCIMMDYAQHGSMFQYLKTEPFTEEIARSYFRQSVTILRSIHKKGIAHRDIKLENLLLDANFRLLVCDFGFAVKYLDINGRRVKISTYMGTPQTAAPELFLQQPYHAVEADLFQIGVVLFQCCAGYSPFKTANIKVDPVYQLIYKNQIGKFWDSHKVSFSPELKDLITKLLAYNPNQRLSIDEIFTHPWMQIAEASQENLLLDMRRRESLLKIECKY